MRDVTPTLLRTVAAIGLAIATSACSANLSLTDVTLAPKASPLTRPDWASFSGGKSDFELRPITAGDLVGPEGQCAGSPGEQVAGAADGSGGGASPAAAPAISGAIALQMTECDVVRRAGTVEKVDFGVDEQGQRAVTLTYMRGPSPGVYRFAGGRLVSMERAPGPPPPPAKAEKKTSKKPAGT
ncbi:MAG: hypothetical protein ACJ8F3_13645 [Xanthobacteraceae bacterium]